MFQAAKHTAASKALKMLRDIPLPDCKAKLDPTSQPFTPGIEYDDLKSPISLGRLAVSCTDRSDPRRHCQLCGFCAGVGRV